MIERTRSIRINSPSCPEAMEVKKISLELKILKRNKND